MKIPNLGDKLNKEIDRLSRSKIDPKGEYYFLSLFSNTTGKFQYQIISKWVGFTEDQPKREMREASLVNAINVQKYFKSINEPPFIINTKDDLKLFILLIGGHGLINAKIATRYIGHLLEPQVFSFVFDDGFVAIDSLPKEKLNRFASPKLRQKILTRDHRRCKICGASPSNNEHVELHLHHIIPYGIGGITEENNLITICQTCHKGLEAPADYSLFDSIGVQMFSKRFSDDSYYSKIELNVFNNLTRESKKRKMITKSSKISGRSLNLRKSRKA